MPFRMSNPIWKENNIMPVATMAKSLVYITGNYSIFQVVTKECNYFSDVQLGMHIADRDHYKKPQCFSFY